MFCYNRKDFLAVDEMFEDFINLFTNYKENTNLQLSVCGQQMVY